MHAQHARAAAHRVAAEVCRGRELRRQQRGAAEAGVDLKHEHQAVGHGSGRRGERRGRRVRIGAEMRYASNVDVSVSGVGVRASNVGVSASASE